MKRTLLAAAVGIFLAAPSAVAQDAPPPVIFSTYYRCNPAQESAADEVVRRVFGPIVQKHVDMGHLTGWVWLAHRQGGAWRRALAILGTDLDTMMDMTAAIFQEFGQQQAVASQRLNTACARHDDYIWIGVANSLPNPNAVGQATLSAYYACDQSRESRANQIFRDVLAPLYEKHAGMGHLTSWGFYAHRFGGVFRRLETFGGADHKTLLQMQAAIRQEANTTNPLAMNEFNQICDWHTDYMWANATTP